MPNGISSLKNLRFAIAFFLFSTVLGPACNREPVSLYRGFYHWQTKFQISDLEKEYLAALSIQKLYVKFFDVDWDFQKSEAIALATLQYDASSQLTIPVIPTIFITNRTLEQIDANELENLAAKIHKKIITQWIQFSPFVLNEIQFDCDWTMDTKEKYFRLLTLLSQKFSKNTVQLSATIRLHQIKYAEETGVPPVERGMLMYYNMGAISDMGTKNSILDNDIGAQYLNLDNYPLPLDLALPLFRWGTVFRNQKLVKLINNLDSSKLVGDNRFTQIKDNYWQVAKSTYFDAYYLYQGDIIRLESVTFAQLQEAAFLLKKNFPLIDRTIVFYHLDETILKDFEINQLEQVMNRFNNFENESPEK